MYFYHKGCSPNYSPNIILDYKEFPAFEYKNRVRSLKVKGLCQPWLDWSKDCSSIWSSYRVV